MSYIICFVCAKFIALCYNYCIYSMYLHREAPVAGSIYFTKCFTSITFSMQCWLTMIFLAEPPSPNHDTVSAVPVGRRGVIRVSWTAPTVPRRELPIIGYIIRYKVQNSPENFRYFSVMSNSETEVTGLNPGTVYRVYVAGVSAIGPGSYCCEGTPVLVTTQNGKFNAS